MVRRLETNSAGIKQRYRINFFLNLSLVYFTAELDE